MPPSYYDCPKYCPEQKQQLITCCAACPVLEQEKTFRQETENALNEALGENWHAWSIPTLLADVTDAFYLSESNPETWTTTTARLVGIVKTEQARLRRIEEFNRDQARKARNGKSS